MFKFAPLALGVNGDAPLMALLTASDGGIGGVVHVLGQKPMVMLYGSINH